MLKLHTCDALKDCLELELPQNDHSTRNRILDAAINPNAAICGMIYIVKRKSLPGSRCSRGKKGIFKQHITVF